MATNSVAIVTVLDEPTYRAVERKKYIYRRVWPIEKNEKEENIQEKLQMMLI